MKFCLSKFIIFLLIILNLAFSQNGKWVIGTGEAIAANITIKQAKFIALQQARANALSKLGISVLAQKQYLNFNGFKKNMDAYLELIQTRTKAKILKEDTLQWSVKLINSIPVYRVRIKVFAVTLLGQPDPTFRVELSINKNEFHNGDEINLRAKVTKDCYLYLFNLFNSDSIIQLFPNCLEKNNFLEAGSIFFFPSENLKKIVEVYAYSNGLRPTKEIVLAVAVKRNIPFSKILHDNFEFPFIPLYKKAFFDLNKWLLRFDASEITEAMATFIVYSN